MVRCPRLVLAGLALLLAGCGTIVDIDRRGMRYMGGTRLDLSQVKDPVPEYRIMIPLFLLDLPLSIAFDTLLLPVNVAIELNRPPKAPEPANGNGETRPGNGRPANGQTARRGDTREARAALGPPP